MAVNATFVADFSKFTDAVAKAEVSLKSFESGAGTVEKRLTTLGNAFSGVKVIQQAELMKAAVEQAGGAANLTEKELQKVTKAAADAGEKMEALGLKTESSQKFLAGFQTTSTQTADSFRGLYTNVTKSTEASDAFRASFTGVAEETQKAVIATTSVASIVEQLGAKFGVSTQAITPFLGSLGSVSAVMAGVVVGAAGVGLAIYKLASSAADAGDKLNDLALKFDLSGSRASVLDAAVKIAGGSTEQLANAIFIMSKNLEGTDDAAEKARGALERMGIQADAFVKLDMDQQIYTLNDAFRTLRPSADDINNLLGRQGKELVPLLSKNLAEAAEKAKALGAQMDDSMVKKSDEAAQASRELSVAWSSFTRDLGVLFLPALKRINDTIESTISELKWFKNAAEGAADGWGYFAKKVAASTDAAELSMRKYLATLKDTVAANALPLGPTGKDVFTVEAEAIKTLNEQMAKQAQAAKESAAATRALHAESDKAAKDYADAVASLDGKVISLNVDLALMGKNLQLINHESGIAATAPGLVSITGGRQVSGGLGTAPTTIPTGINLSPGGIKASLIALKTEWLDVGTIGDNVAKGFIRNIGAMLSGGLTSLISGGISLLSKGIQSLFGASEESKKVSPIRDEFFKMAGGLDVLNPKVLALTGSLTAVDAILKAKTVDQYNAALKNMNDILGLQDKAMADLTTTAQKYGFTLDELGPALQRQNLDAQAQTLYKDFQLLESGGIDNIAVLTRMSDATNEYLHNALKMGIEVPEAMRPMLEAMAKQGTLTDAAGNKIDDLEAAGISFSLTMSEGFKALIDEVKNLTNAISVGLGLAIRNIPEPTVTVHARYDTSDIPNSPDYGGQDYTGGSTGGVVYAARGRIIPFVARGTDTVPAMLSPGETVRTRGQESDLTSLVRQTNTLLRQQARQPEELAVILRDVLVKALRRA